MNAKSFTYWLQGFFELSETTDLSPKQIQMIKDHLNLVFEKVTPDRVTNDVKKKEPETFVEALEGLGITDPFANDSICSSTSDLEDAVRYCQTAVSC